MKGKIALIVGATGLIGSELLKILLETEDYSKVVVMTRTPLSLNHTKLVEKLINFNNLEKYEADFAVDDVFCCLGTTIKKAKTMEAMYKVDVEYPLAVANLALAQGAKQFLVISAMNADPNSKLSYPKMKGELEQQLKTIPFESLSILRPSLLLGERKEFRFGERVAGAIFKTIPFLFKGKLKKYKPIHGKDVALAMYRIAQMQNLGVNIYPSDQLES